MKNMTTYEILTDMLLLEDELKEYDLYRNWELFDGDDGYVSFIQEKIEAFEKRADEYYLADGNPSNWGIADAMGDFVAKNVDKWKRELRGEKLYKIKVVLEIDATVNDKTSIDEIIKHIGTSVSVESDDAWGWNADSWKIINAIGKEADE